MLFTDTAIWKTNPRKLNDNRCLYFMRTTITPFLLSLVLLSALSLRSWASTQEALQTSAVAGLDTLVAELVADRPADTNAYIQRLQAYLGSTGFEATVGLDNINASISLLKGDLNGRLNPLLSEFAEGSPRIKDIPQRTR